MPIKRVGGLYEVGIPVTSEPGPFPEGNGDAQHTMIVDSRHKKTPTSAWVALTRIVIRDANPAPRRTRGGNEHKTKIMGTSSLLTKNQAVWVSPRSQRSPDGVKRSPGNQIPHYAALHAGYAGYGVGTDLVPTACLHRLIGLGMTPSGNTHNQ